MSYSQASESIAENVDNVRRPGVDRFVIAVDYGTTYTGQSYEFLNFLWLTELFKVLLLQLPTPRMPILRKLKSCKTGHRL